MAITVGMPKEFKQKWKIRFLETIKRLWEEGKISRGTYYDLKDTVMKRNEK